MAKKVSNYPPPGTKKPDPPPAPPAKVDGIVIHRGNVDDGFVAGTLLETPEPRYKYLNVMLSNAADINRFGDEGWELVSVIPATLDRAVFYFRKRV